MEDLSIWDCAESFTPKEAGALIAGLDPNSIEGFGGGGPVFLRVGEATLKAFYAAMKHDPIPPDGLLTQELELTMHPDFVPSIFIDRTGRTLHGMETLARAEIVRWLSAIGMKSVYQFDLVSKLPIDAKQSVPEQRPATPAPVVAVGASDDVKPTSNAPAWRLIPSLARAPGYRWPLYQFLHAAYIAGQPCPKARDFLEWLKSNPNPDLEVMPDGLKYDSAGSPKEAYLKAIQQAIKGMLQK